MPPRLPIRLPCPFGERWTEMTPEEGGRRCARCDRHLIDLSRLTAPQASQLVAVAKNQRICAKVDRDVDGKPIFAKRAARRLVSTAAGVVMSVSIAACGADDASPPRSVELRAEPEEPLPPPEEPETAQARAPAPVPDPDPDPAPVPDPDPAPDPVTVPDPDPHSDPAPPTARRASRRRPRRRPPRRHVDDDPLVGLLGE